MHKSALISACDHKNNNVTLHWKIINIVFLHNPETWLQPNARNHHQHRQTNSAALPNVGYKYHRILSILHPGKQRVSRINNLCKQEKVVRSNNAYRQSRSVRLVFREGCHWLISTWQPCWRGKKKKMLNRENQFGIETSVFLKQ